MITTNDPLPGLIGNLLDFEDIHPEARLLIELALEAQKTGGMPSIAPIRNWNADGAGNGAVVHERPMVQPPTVTIFNPAAMCEAEVPAWVKQWGDSQGYDFATKGGQS